LDRFLRRKEVMQRTSLSNSELYALMAEGRFPKSFKLTGTTHANEHLGVVVWSELEVTAWMASRKATRDASPAPVERVKNPTPFTKQP
jgi:prophage regulatory protein